MTRPSRILYRVTARAAARGQMGKLRVHRAEREDHGAGAYGYPRALCGAAPEYGLTLVAELYGPRRIDRECPRCIAATGPDDTIDNPRPDDADGPADTAPPLDPEPIAELAPVPAPIRVLNINAEDRPIGDYVVDLRINTFLDGTIATIDYDLTLDAARSLRDRLIGAITGVERRILDDVTAGPCDLCGNVRMIYPLRHGRPSAEHCPICRPRLRGVRSAIDANRVPDEYDGTLTPEAKAAAFAQAITDGHEPPVAR